MADDLTKNPTNICLLVCTELHNSVLNLFISRFFFAFFFFAACFVAKY